jgi:cell division protein FtsI (penicillin-binding protein 3)
MRFRLLKVFYLLFLTTIALRLFYWQVIKAEDLSAMADSQHISQQTIEAPRGVIFSSDGSILATNQPTFLLYGLPKVIKDKADISSKLATAFLPTDIKDDPTTKEDEVKKVYQDLKDKFVEKLSQNLFWVPLQRNLTSDQKKQINALKLEGLGFDQYTSRYYPEGSSSAHVLGFVAADANGQQLGYFGLEGYYNGELKGVPGEITEEKDAQGSPILIGKYIKKDPQQGHDLVLNLDRTIQYITEKKVREGIQKYGAKGAYAVIMEPKTGAVIAMASYPNYDPGDITNYPKQNFRNPVVGDGYEPGSTFKTLIMAAAINENLVTPETICDICRGPVQISGFSIRTWDNKYRSDSTMRDVLVHSDNVGMVFISRKLGIDKMYDYIQKFGIGNPTNIDLQDEYSPEIRSKKDWKEIDLATSSFGQGIATTGIQVVRAISVIANGGDLMEPHLVHYIKKDNKTIEIKPKVVGSPITAQTAATVTQMMVDAVDKGESQYYKKKAGVGNFKIAGKTGTAQIPVAGHYDATKTIASFIGFAPADDPKFVMLVRYVEPTTSIYGAETAAPTFFDIARELFTYYNIAPNE